MKHSHKKLKDGNTYHIVGILGMPHDDFYPQWK